MCHYALKASSFSVLNEQKPSISSDQLFPVSILGQTYANLTETGKLMLMGFKESMSGAYTCTLSHRIIETMTQEEVDVFETYKFMLYGKITCLLVS